MPNINTENATLNIHPVLPVSKAIEGIFIHNVSGYVTESYINAANPEESIGRTLNPNEMLLLREKIANIKNNFYISMQNENLSPEELELAKIIYIYNYILKEVQYANVLSANDGTARVRNRSEDSLVPNNSAYSALILKRSVCCGISDAIFLLCKALGVECEKWLWPDGGHAYNKVKIGNNWYKVDATFQIGFYPHAKANAWSDAYLLTGTANHNQTAAPIYPRERITRMKSLLESRGIDFNYDNAPQIQIRTTLDGLNTLTNVVNKGDEEKRISIKNLQNIITSIDEELSIKPTITIKRRSDQNSQEEDKPKIYFIPTEKKITIQKVNYKINIVAVNDGYAVNVETANNEQFTQITNNQGKIVGILRRGLEVISSLLNPDNYSPSDNLIRIINTNQQTQRHR